MTPDEARLRVTEMRETLRSAMRAVSVPEPDWHMYQMGLVTLSMQIDDAGERARHAD